MPVLTAPQQTTQMIQKLDAATINRIAAGEVVERPASVIKELIENSIDAGASKINISTENAGKSLIRIEDNGCGIARSDLPLALERHATSKLTATDLQHIATLGFRGEGLAAISAVAEITLAARQQNSSGWQISSAPANTLASAKQLANGANDGGNYQIAPANCQVGCTVTVNNLFQNIPARQKFLRSNSSEIIEMAATIKRLAIAQPQIGFTWISEGKQRLNVPFGSDAKSRIANIIGEQFAANSIVISAEANQIKLEGYVCLPHLHQVNSLQQYLYVNGRPLKDKLLRSAAIQAYRDLLPTGRFPSLVLFISLPNELVDVNIHPTKLEVRFLFPQDVRKLIISAIQREIGNQRAVAQPVIGDRAVALGRRNQSNAGIRASNFQLSQRMAERIQQPWTQGRSGTNEHTHHPHSQQPAVAASPQQLMDTAAGDQSLGQAVAQIDNTYILAAHDDGGLVIVDQHAAHERLTYEILKKNLTSQQQVKLAPLLVPAVVQLPPEYADILLSERKQLVATGLELEADAPPGGIKVTAIPALLATTTDIAQLVTDVAAELLEQADTQQIEQKMWAICAKIACYGSIRAGRKMSIDEMNALLRQMEATPFSDVCNHGRPTHIALTARQLASLFART